MFSEGMMKERKRETNGIVKNDGQPCYSISFKHAGADIWHLEEVTRDRTGGRRRWEWRGERGGRCYCERHYRRIDWRVVGSVNMTREEIRDESEGSRERRGNP